MKLEKQLERLEQIVAELERNPVDLARALTLFEEGVACLRTAAEGLTEAETRVKRLTELANGAFVVEEFDADE